MSDFIKARCESCGGILVRKSENGLHGFECENCGTIHFIRKDVAEVIVQDGRTEIPFEECETFVDSCDENLDHQNEKWSRFLLMCIYAVFFSCTYLYIFRFFLKK